MALLHGNKCDVVGRKFGYTTPLPGPAGLLPNVRPFAIAGISVGVRAGVAGQRNERERGVGRLLTEQATRFNSRNWESDLIQLSD
jgi:hypothetical protein